MSFSLSFQNGSKGVCPLLTGIAAGFTYASLDRVALLITDMGATDEDVEILEEAGIHEVLRVPHLN